MSRASPLKADTSSHASDTSPVAVLQGLVQEDLAQVNQLIIELARSKVELIPAISEYLIGSGGKRLRPMLTLAASGLCGYEGEHHIALAASVEFIHTATLLHDDVVDGSFLRRGLSTANEVWGNKASILVGDFLFAQAFRLMVQSESWSVLSVLSDASAVIAEGEVLQLTANMQPLTAEGVYYDVISAKTARLFAAACEVGGLIAGNRQAAEALRQYGDGLGMAFQIVDDALDYASDSDTLGKRPGDDYREGKITLPVILAYRRATNTEQLFLNEQFKSAATRHPGGFDEMRELLARYEVIPACLDVARRYARTAEEQLHALPDNAYREALARILHYTINRSF